MSVRTKYPWTPETASAIGVDWILAAIAPTGAFGREARARERAFLRGDESAARAALAHIDALAHAYSAELIDELRATIAETPDIRDALARARVGAPLDDVDFFEIQRFLDALERLVTLGSAQSALLALPLPDAALRAALAPGRTASRTFYLADAFAPELAQRRGEAARAQAAFDLARGGIAARIARDLGRETLGDDAFTVPREALPQPLPPGLRIVREAPTYALCALELDDAALAALAARDNAIDAVARAEEAIRTHLGEAVARVANALGSACDALGVCETLLARATFAKRYACVVPELGDAPAIALTEMRYLPLAEALAAHGRTYAPLSLDLHGMGVVTGPNMGGKSASLRALGFAVACATLGVPVPARAARLALVDEIAWLGVGVQPDADALLSAFGAEIVDLRRLLETAAPRALVLLDEFARTTSPHEGRALLVALLEGLRERGAFGLAATHLAHIAADAGLPHFALGGVGDLGAPAAGGVALDDALARIARAMDYRLLRVAEDAPPATGAIALAEALGLDAALVARARNHAARA